MPSEFGPGLSLWVAQAIAILFVTLFVIARLNYLAIPRLPVVEPGNAPPDCMVVIPARNEELSIARAVASLPHDTVIVVDDHSEDGTAEAARKAGAGVLLAPDLPARALGKSNACIAGARVLTSRWVLFADADTSFEPCFLDSAVACANASGLSFLSIYLRPECTSWVERILVPYAVALFFCGTSPKSDPVAAFNGQCMLVHREAYEFIGGHAPVITNMVEDVKLAALARRHRLKFAIARAEALGHVRFHAGALWSGFERNAFRFMMVNPWAGTLVVLSALLGLLALAAAAWLAVDRQPTAAVAMALLPSLTLAVWYRNPLHALLAPLAICAMAPVIANGVIAVFTGRRIEWKGRAI